MPRKPRTKKTRKPTNRRSKKATVSPVKGEKAVVATYKSIPYKNKPVVWPTANGEVSQRCIIQMGYDDLNIAVAPGAISHIYNFALNSIYNPDRTGVAGYQPNFHDIMSTLYTKYKVHAVKYSVGFVSGQNTTRTLLAVTATDTLPTVTALDVTRARAKQSVFIGRANTQAENGVLSGFLKLKTVSGPPFNDTGFSGTYGADPSDLVYMGVNLNTEDATTNLAGKLNVRLTFYVESYQPKTVRALD